MRVRRLARTSGALIASALLIAGCGKSALPVHSGETGAQGAAAGAGSGASAPARSSTLLGPSGSGGIVTGSTSRLGGASPLLDAAAVARAIYPGLTAAGRPQTVVIVADDDWPAALAACALAGAPLRAPILYSEGGSLPALSRQALEAMRPTGAVDIGGAPQVITVGEALTVPGYRTLALDASTPYALAAKIAALVEHLHGGHVGAAILAGIGGPPALSMPAAGLAAESGDPILLTGSGSLPAATGAELGRLGLPAVYAVGPAAAIPAGLLAGLRRGGPVRRPGNGRAAHSTIRVRRIGGGEAVENAIGVAAFTDGSFGWGVREPGHGLVFARASRPFDAPAAAPLSAGADYGPLLLLSGSEGVPAALQRYLRDIQPGYTSAPESLPVRGVYNHGWLIGDGAAISIRTQSELDALLRSVPSQGASPPSKP